MTPGTGLYVSLDQQRPEAALMMALRTFGSRPRLVPKFSVSEMPAIEMPNIILLQILAT